MMENLPPNQKSQEKKSKEQVNFLQYAGMATQMGATIGICVFLGFKLDAWMQTKVVFILLGSLIGVGLSLYTFIKKAMSN